MAQAHSVVALSIWLCVAAWAYVMAGRCRGRELPGALPVWIAGWGAYVVHALAAFATHYHWSHAVALAETARQTRELTGFDSGAGLWWNYLFGLVWAAEGIRWFATGRPQPVGRWKRPHFVVMGFLAFMVFNGTVVFGQGAARGFGVAVFLLLGMVWLAARIRERRR